MPISSERNGCRALPNSTVQTSPDDVVITGNHAAVQRQVGNAVPSLLAEVLAREIRTQLLGRRPLSIPLVLLPRIVRPHLHRNEGRPSQPSITRWSPITPRTLGQAKGRVGGMCAQSLRASGFTF